MALRLSTGFRNKTLGQAASIALNGDFTTDTTSWTAVGATLASVASGQSGNALEVTSSGAALGQAYQDVTTVIGRMYKLTCYFKQGTSGFGSIQVGDSGDPNAIAESGALSDAAWTQKTILFIATAVSTRITLETTDPTITETSLFDELVVDEIMDGVKAILRNCKIAIYSGAQPADADSVKTGTLLVTISESGGATGLTWGDALAGVLSKAVAETWQGTAVATDTAGWFRCYQDGDDPALASTVMARFDGSVSTSGAQLNMSSTAIVTSAVQTISAFTFTQPAS
jgi:hypothetical protein